MQFQDWFSSKFPPYVFHQYWKQSELLDLAWHTVSTPQSPLMVPKPHDKMYQLFQKLYRKILCCPRRLNLLDLWITVEILIHRLMSMYCQFCTFNQTEEPQNLTFYFTKSEPPMPIFITSVIDFPVYPFQLPLRTSSLKVRMWARTLLTPGMT